MARSARFLLVPAGLLATAFLGLLVAEAEKPMSGPAQLAASATHIVRGTVERVHSRVRRQGSFENTDYVAQVKVDAVEKGEGVRLDRPLYARYWSKHWKGPGYPPPGTNGHAPLPKEGAAVRLYLARNAYDGFGTEKHDGGYNVLGVNGVQLLTPPEIREAEAKAAPQTLQRFPESWYGVWTGALTIAKPARAPEEAKMVLAIRPTDDPKRFEFRFRYGREEDWRQYELVEKDAATGRWAIDEKNGIVLPATYVDGELFSYFSIGGNLILARYRLVEDFLHFDLTQTSLTPGVRSGGAGTQKVGGHDTPVVQRAVLRR